MRKFTIIVVSLLLIMTSSYSQFSIASNIRVRSEIGTTNPYAVTNRMADIRYRPTFNYKVNDNLTYTATLEFGDIGFGNISQGGSQGTDGRIVELKHLFMAITPPSFNLFDRHCIKIGLQAHKDMHGLVFNDDVAGIYYDAQIKKLEFSTGWFVPRDIGETMYDSDTYSAGESMFSLELSYDILDNLNSGVYSLLSFSEDFDETDDTHVKETSTTRFWIAPYVTGSFGKFNFETEFVYYRKQVEETALLLVQNIDEHAALSGVAYSLKADYEFMDRLGARLNILLASGVEEGYFGGYEGHTAHYNTDLEVMNSTYYTNGIHYYDPLYKSSGGTNQGIMLPALVLDYKLLNEKFSIIDKMNLEGFFGMGISLNPIGYVKDDELKEGSVLGVEYGIRSKMKVLEDLDMIPYFAMFHFGEPVSIENVQRNQYKLGMTLKMMLK